MCNEECITKISYRKNKLFKRSDIMWITRLEYKNPDGTLRKPSNQLVDYAIV